MTALDFSEDMLARAKAKRAGKVRLWFPCGGGLMAESLYASLIQAGFGCCETFSLSRISAAERNGAPI